MTSSPPTKTYPWPEYEVAHQQTFAPPKTKIPSVLPVGVTKGNFDLSIKELVSAIGVGAVFLGDALAHYVDPYDVYEDDESKRKVPSAAVTCGYAEVLRSLKVILLNLGVQAGLHGGIATSFTNCQ